MFCIKCGKRITDDMQFCPFCGAKQSISVEKNIRENVNEDEKTKIEQIDCFPRVSIVEFSYPDENGQIKEHTLQLFYDNDAPVRPVIKRVVESLTKGQVISIVSNEEQNNYEVQVGLEDKTIIGNFKIVLPQEKPSSFTNFGIQLYDAKEYTNAIKLLMAAATCDDPRAQYYIGAMYCQGLGVELDKDKAIHWLSLAAEQGNEQAKSLCEDLKSEKGIIYQLSNGESIDKEESIQINNLHAKIIDIADLEYDIASLRLELILFFFTKAINERFPQNRCKQKVYDAIVNGANGDNPVNYEVALKCIKQKGFNYSFEDLDFSVLVSLIFDLEILDTKSKSGRYLLAIRQDRNILSHEKGGESIEKLKTMLRNTISNIFGFFESISDGWPLGDEETREQYECFLFWIRSLYVGVSTLDGISLDIRKKIHDILREEDILNNEYLFRTPVILESFSDIRQSILKTFLEVEIKNKYKSADWQFAVYDAIKDGVDGKYRASYLGASNLIDKVGFEEFYKGMDVTILHSLILNPDLITVDDKELRKNIGQLNNDRNWISHFIGSKYTQDFQCKIIQAGHNILDCYKAIINYLIKNKRDNEIVSAFKEKYGRWANNCSHVGSIMNGTVSLRQSLEKAAYQNILTDIADLEKASANTLSFEEKKQNFGFIHNNCVALQERIKIIHDRSDFDILTNRIQQIYDNNRFVWTKYVYSCANQQWWSGNYDEAIYFYEMAISNLNGLLSCDGAAELLKQCKSKVRKIKVSRFCKKNWWIWLVLGIIVSVILTVLSVLSWF